MFIYGYFAYLIKGTTDQLFELQFFSFLTVIQGQCFFYQNGSEFTVHILCSQLHCFTILTTIIFLEVYNGFSQFSI